jgi:hypothetical protein
MPNPVLLIVAIILDIFGFLCLMITLTVGPEVGETLSFVPDFMGLFIIGGFELYSHRRAFFKKAKTMRKKAGKKGGFKFLGAFFGELLPLIGAMPFWTIYVITAGAEEEYQQATEPA